MTPHTEAKHRILRAYFGSWFSIIGQRFPRALFVDGFCGPGEYSAGEQGSPVVVIEEARKALAYPRLRLRHDFKLELYLIDVDGKRIANLTGVLNGLGSLDGRLIAHLPIVGEFEEQIVPVLQDAEGSRQRTGWLVPLLVFIDPFGPKGFSMETVGRILALDGAEIFMLFDVDGLDRLLMRWDGSDQEQLTTTYGLTAERFEPIRQLNNQRQRIVELRKLYLESLRAKKLASGFLPFRIYGTDGTPMHDLIFLTNNELGFVKMKDAMWKADASGEFRFGDADQGQLTLPLEGTHEERLWKKLMGEFAGKTVSGAVVQRFVNLRTIYLKTHKTCTLRLHESDRVPADQRIGVTRRSSRGPKGYPDDAEITFPAQQA